MARHGWVLELLETAVLTVVIFLVVRVALQNFRVDGESMSPNLHNGEYILVNKIDYKIGSPKRGDIVVFQATPAGRPDADFIKRVIGLPGETVSVHNNAVYINGKRLREPYIDKYHRPSYIFPAAKVPPGDYFVLGDNRNNSQDSHLWRWLPKKYIIGKAWVSYFPFSEVQVFSLRLPLPTVPLPLALPFFPGGNGG